MDVSPQPFINLAQKLITPLSGATLQYPRRVGVATFKEAKRKTKRRDKQEGLF